MSTLDFGYGGVDAGFTNLKASRKRFRELDLGGG